MKHRMNLVIANIIVRMDEDGRFCINDLHKASGGEKRHQPSNWLSLQQTIDLIRELSTPVIPGVEQIQPLRVVNGGSNPGTYVCKELVYAYAMWISASFHLQVIRSYDSMISLPAPKPSSNRALSSDFKAWYGIAKLIGMDKNAAAIAANQAVLKETGKDVLSTIGATHLLADVQDSMVFTPTELGSRYGISGFSFNKALEAAGLQVKINDKWVPTEAAKGLFRLFDTGKSQGTGVPVNQIKWYDKVLDIVTLPRQGQVIELNTH